MPSFLMKCQCAEMVAIMDKANIMAFAGLMLEKHFVIDAPSLQKFIMARDEVGKAVSIEDIEDSLDLLRYAGFIKQKKDTFIRRNFNA